MLGRCARCVSNRLLLSPGEDLRLLKWPASANEWSGRGCDVLSHLGRERRRERLRLLGRGACVQVAARGGERAVAHRLLDGSDIDSAHRQQRAERVAQVMEAQRTHAGDGLGAAVSLFTLRGKAPVSLITANTSSTSRVVILAAGRSPSAAMTCPSVVPRPRLYGAPGSASTESREELRQATGDTKLPALKLADGTVLTHSRSILAWIGEQS